MPALHRHYMLNHSIDVQFEWKINFKKELLMVSTAKLKVFGGSNIFFKNHYHNT